MHVVHVITQLDIGGAETMMVRMVEATKEHDHSVISLLPGGAYVARLRNAGAKVTTLNCTRSAQAAWQFPHFAKLLRDLQPDLVQGWMYHGNIAASLGRRVAGNPPVIWNIRQTVMQLSDNKAMTRGFVRAGKWLGKGPACIIYNSRMAAGQHEAFGYPAQKRRIIANGFDLERFAPREPARSLLLCETGLGKQAFIVARVARNADQKDNPALFAAFEEIANEIPKAHLVLFGRGMTANDPDLAALCNASRHAARIHFMGERTDLDRMTAGFDVAVSSSAHSEGFSNAIGEAMAAGVPVVATDIGDAQDLVNSPDQVVPARDPHALARAVIRLALLKPYDRNKIGAAGKRHIAKNYTLDQIGASYSNLWNKVLLEHRNRA